MDNHANYMRPFAGRTPQWKSVALLAFCGVVAFPLLIAGCRTFNTQPQRIEPMAMSPEESIDCLALALTPAAEVVGTRVAEDGKLASWIAEQFAVDRQSIKYDRVEANESRLLLESYGWDDPWGSVNLQLEDGELLKATSYHQGSVPSIAQAINCLGDPDGYVSEYLALYNTQEDDASFKLRIYWLDEGVIVQTFVPAEEKLPAVASGLLFSGDSSASTNPTISVTRVEPGSLEEVIWRADYSPKYMIGWASEERTARTAARYLPWPGSPEELIFTVTLAEAATPVPTAVPTPRDDFDD